MGVTYEMDGDSAIIRSVSGGNFLYKIIRPRKIFYNGDEIYIIDSCLGKIRITADGIKRYGW